MIHVPMLPPPAPISELDAQLTGQPLAKSARVAILPIGNGSERAH